MRPRAGGVPCVPVDAGGGAGAGCCATAAKDTADAIAAPAHRPTSPPRSALIFGIRSILESEADDPVAARIDLLEVDAGHFLQIVDGLAGGDLVPVGDPRGRFLPQHRGHAF